VYGNALRGYGNVVKAYPNKKKLHFWDSLFFIV
jgi:hypothetical protein